jgi:predicted ester cyclase
LPSQLYRHVYRHGVATLVCYTVLNNGETVATSGKRKESETMSTEDNKAYVRRYLGEISGKEKPRAVQDQYIADSDEELKEHIAFFESSFPHYALPIDDMIAEGDKVTAHLRFEGTHNGELLGIAPTGKKVSVPFVVTYRLAGGKIVQHWMSFDRMALMEQLGVAPT